MHPECKFSLCPPVKRLMRLSLFTDDSLRVLIFAALKGQSFSISEVADGSRMNRMLLVHSS
jgi:hypothetical protein